MAFNNGALSAHLTMFMTRRLRQPLQPFFQCRSFAVDDYLDTPDVDSDAEDDGAATAKKAKVMSKKKNKNSTTVNPKQRVENLQTFYDAAEAALK